VKELFNQELQLTVAQGKVLNLIVSWLGQNNFSKEDQTKAKQIWLQYINITDTKKKTNLNIRIWAAAVIYILGKQRGYAWLNQTKLAEAFKVSIASISTRWQEISKTLEENRKVQRKNIAKLTTFIPNDETMKLFHELILFTRTSAQWRSYITEVFDQFIEIEVPPLPVDLLLELLLFITCDRTLPDGKKIIDYFLESAMEFTKEKIAFLKQIKASKFGLFEVKTLGKRQVLLLRDLFRDQEVKMEIDSIDSKEVKKGGFMMGRIIPYQDDGNTLWRPAIYLTILETLDIAELEPIAKRWFWEYSVTHKGWATKEDFIQENSFRFWRWFLARSFLQQ
jgi:hypothetical protein